jgi:acid phosphatase
MKRLIAIVALTALAGCATAGAPPAPQPAPETPSVQTAPEPAAPEPAPAPEAPAAEAPAGELSGAVHWVRDSAEYRAAAIQTYRAAGHEIERLAGVLEPGSWAVALDGDDTVISNSLYQKERDLAGGRFTPESWAAWVERREAPPVPGAVDFLERVRALGGRIAIVTNRSDEQCPDTEADFREEGIPYDVMLCKVGGVSDKQPRWDSVAEGTASPGLPPLEIVMWIGDNIGDFPGLGQAMRNGPPDGYDKFGETYFLIPNPMYGSWERNPAE